MVSQVTMFATVEDMSALLSLAAEAGARAYPSIAVTDVTPAPLDLSTCANQRDASSYLLLPSPLAAVEIFYLRLTSDHERSQVDCLNSPVVIVDTCNANGRELFNGRLFLGNDPSDPRHGVAKKLYGRLAKAVKTWEKTPRFGIHVGPMACQQARKGKIVLRHHALTLEPP